MSDINIIQMNIMLYCTTKVQEDNVAKGYKKGFEAMQRLFLTLLHYIRHASIIISFYLPLTDPSKTIPIRP